MLAETENPSHQCGREFIPDLFRYGECQTLQNC